MKSRLRMLLPPGLLFLVVFAVFAPALRFDLVTLDDFSFVATNPLVIGGFRLSSVRDAFLAPVPTAPMYIPLLWISYMLDVSLFGYHPWAFHLANVLLHSGSALLLFFLLLRLARRSPPGGTGACLPSLVAPCFLLALLWAVHPLRVESVAWISERKDCLAAFFCLMTLHAWLSALDASSSPRRIVHGTAALFLFALGLLSKPSLVPLPVFLGLLAWLSPPVSGRLPGKNRCRGFLPLLLRWSVVLLPFCLLSALSALLTSAFHAEQASLPPPPLLSRLATVPTLLLFYLSKTLLPRHLSVLYPQWTAPLWVGAILALPFLTAAVCLFRRRASAPLPFLGTAFAALFLLPVSGLVAISYNLVADRYSCLPAIGLSIALLHFFPPKGAEAPPPPAGRSPVVPRASRLRGLLTTALFCACAACAVATMRQLPVWRDSDALFLPARRLLPDHYTIRIYDARLARAHGDFATARKCSARAAGALSDYYLFLGDVPNVNALDGPQAALSLLLANPPPPTSLPHWSVLAASAQLALDRPGDALATATAALPSANAGDPFRKILLQIAMIASHRLGDDSSALAFARKAGAAPPDADGVDTGHFLLYYAFLWSNDDRLPALRYFRELAESSPTPSVLNNIAWILASAFYSPAPSSEAVSYARRALDALPLDSPLRPALLDTLAVALANDGQFDAAVSAVSDAIALLPPSSPSLPAMRRRLSLYRRSLPYRELWGDPVSPEKYAFDPHL